MAHLFCIFLKAPIQLKKRKEKLGLKKIITTSDVAAFSEYFRTASLPSCQSSLKICPGLLDQAMTS